MYVTRLLINTNSNVFVLKVVNLYDKTAAMSVYCDITLKSAKLSVLLAVDNVVTSSVVATRVTGGRG